MASLNPYPVDDVVEMARIAGYTVFEIENFWTDELLSANMSYYYDGTLTRIVNPGQGIQAEDVSVAAHFAEGVEQDLTNALESAKQVTGNLAEAVIQGTAALPRILETLPLVFLAAVGVGLYVLARKA